jgi:hypothetical protein
LAPWKEIIRTDNSRHYDHCTYYTGVAGGNPAPSSLLAEGTRPGQPTGVGLYARGGGNVGIFEAVFGRPRAAINRPVPAAPAAGNARDELLDILRRRNPVENNRDLPVNLLTGEIIAPRPERNNPTAALNRPRPLLDIPTREDTGRARLPRLSRLLEPDAHPYASRRERDLPRPNIAARAGEGRAEPLVNEGARPRIRPLLLARRLNESPRLQAPAERGLPALPSSSRETANSSNLPRGLNLGDLVDREPRARLRRPPSSPLRLIPTFDGSNQVNPPVRARANLGSSSRPPLLPGVVTNNQPNEPRRRIRSLDLSDEFDLPDEAEAEQRDHSRNQPNGPRRLRRPGVNFDLPDQPEDQRRDLFWSHLGRLGEPTQVSVVISIHSI